MGLPVLILGESGSGKSYSIKNMNPEKVGIFAVEKSLLPFRSKGFKIAKNATYNTIGQALKEPKMKSYIIDDSQYLMVNEYFANAKDTGYQKYTDIGLHFQSLIHYINHSLPDDVIVYFLHHIEQDGNTGKKKAKTVGKMLDNYLTLEGCFNIVLECRAEGKDHFFVTQSDGYNTAKSPEGMFEEKIANDLNVVDETIRDYYDIKEEKMNKPTGYDEARAFGEFESIELGGHILDIKKVEELTTKTGRPYIKVTFDTAFDDRQPKFYENQWNKDSREGKKWGGWTNIFVEGYEGGTSPQFKGFCTAVEDSNNGFELVWGENFCGSLKGKRIGGLFREEDYKDNKGEVRTARKLAWFRGTDGIEEEPIPKRKELKLQPIPSDVPSWFEAIGDDDLPF